MAGRYLYREKSEPLYSFEFSEDPGVFLKFLNTLGGHWNIFMFYCCNHKSAYGYVLIGLQVVGEETNVIRYLDELDYLYQDKSDNSVCKLFFAT